MKLVVRTLALLAACFLIAPSVSLADDMKVSPEAARKNPAISRDAAQKVKPELKEAAKIKPEVEKVAPGAKQALEAQAPKVDPRMQQPGATGPR